MTPIQSLTRAMSVLSYMANAAKNEYSIAELANAVDLPPSSVYRILQTFAADGYVSFDEKAHLYGLGAALIPLGRAADQGNDLCSIAQPFLQKIADETGDDTFLMELSGYHSRVIAKAVGPNRIKIVNDFQSNFDLHCGANRKILLAFQPDNFIEEYIHRGLKKYTDATICEPEALWQEIRSIRIEHISFSDSEFIEGAMGISAPIFDYTHKLVASIGTSSPAFQATPDKIRKQKQVIADCAEKLSAILGYRPDVPQN